MKLKQLSKIFALALGLVITPKIVLAHAIQTNYLLESDTLEIQSVFGAIEESPNPNAQVTIYAPNNPEQPWLETQTDGNGEFSFKPDFELQGEWAVEIGDGNSEHWDRIIVPITDQGIDYIEISDLPSDDHQHYDLANPVLITLIGLSGAIGLKLLTRKS